MGLLDNLLKGTGDPEKDRALSQGLLQAGLSLLASKGNFGSALGQAGMAGVQGYQGAQEMSYRDQQRKMQMEQLKRQQAMQALPQQFMKPGTLPPTMDNRDVGQPGEPAIPARQFDFTGYADALAQYDPAAAMQMRASLQKSETPLTLSEGARLVTPSGKLIAENPKDVTTKEPEAIRALKAVYGEGSPEYLAALKRYGGKLTDSSPSSVQEYEYAKGQGYRGSFEQFELSRRRAGASSVNIDRAPPGYRWEGPGKLGAIPGGPADKLPEKQQGQVIGVQNLRDAIGEYRSQLDTHSKADVLNPAARAEMGTKYQNMMLQAKEAYNLGVLNGPDMKVLESVITNPMSINGLMTPRRSLDRQAAELDRIMSKMAGVASQTRPRGAAGATVGIDPSAIDAELRRRGQ